MTSYFTISLDFELHWGVFDKRNRAERMPVYRATRKLIPRLLQLFAENQVHVTWATVGSLFAANEKIWQQHAPTILPQYHALKYSPYQFAAKQGLGSEWHDAHFAPDLVMLIPQYPGQELATHTFSHYYCLEAGQTPEAFAADLEVVQHLSRQLVGQTLRSLVFPRNQFNRQYLALCTKAGITAIRSNPSVWYWSGIRNDDASLLRRAIRTGDGFIPLGPPTSYPLSHILPEDGLPVCLPASRLLREHDTRRPWANRLRLNRILKEMTTAAQKGHVYHLWWHPENFGHAPEACVAELQQIINHFAYLRQAYGMQPANMNELANLALHHPIHS